MALTTHCLRHFTALPEWEEVTKEVEGSPTALKSYAEVLDEKNKTK